MGLLNIVKSSIMLSLYFYKNNKANFISMLIWPYLMLGLVVGLGFFIGDPNSFKRNVGLDVNPLTFFIASTIVAMSSIDVMWSIAGSIVFYRWVGVLEYIFLTPHRMSLTLILSGIPSYILNSTMFLLVLSPLLLLQEGLALGLLKLAVIYIALILGMLPLIGFAVIFASLTLITEEEENFLQWLNPLILLFSGAFYPVYLLPWWVRMISMVLPSTYTIELARLTALMGSPDFGRFTFLIGVLFGLTLIYNLFAAGIVGHSERLAMKKGVV